MQLVGDQKPPTSLTLPAGNLFTTSVIIVYSVSGSSLRANTNVRTRSTALPCPVHPPPRSRGCLHSCRGVLLTKRSHRPLACRNCAKNNSCPSRVTGASSSNSAKYRPPVCLPGHGSALKNPLPSGWADFALPSSSTPHKINILLQLPCYSIAVFRPKSPQSKCANPLRRTSFSRGRRS
jgi:hypothetical protein